MLSLLLALAAISGSSTAAPASVTDIGPPPAHLQAVVSDRQKPLPRGFQHFQPVPAELSAAEIPSDGFILCRELHNAISFGRQLWLGADPHQAIQRLRQAWGGDTPCGYAPGLRVRMLEYAIRGDNDGHRIFVTKWIDQNGRTLFMAEPYPRN
jgi:hypothetical protein